MGMNGLEFIAYYCPCYFTAGWFNSNWKLWVPDLVTSFPGSHTYQAKNLTIRSKESGLRVSKRMD